MIVWTDDGPDLPDLTTPEAITAEIGWVAREASELVGSTDDTRREAYLARKRALIARLEDRHGEGTG